MASMQSEAAILNRALLALKEEAGLDLMSDSTLSQEHSRDSEADFRIKTPDHILIIEVKRNLRPAHLGAIIHKFKSLKSTGLLVADYINPNIAKALKDQGVQYLDICGNSYLNMSPVFVHISGHKPETEPKREANIAFESSGLKLIYGLLCNKDLVNANYRNIAQQTGVALGAIGPILNGLQEAGYLINPGKATKRRLVKRRKLLDRWVETYPEKLRPKLLLGEFIGADTTWWNTIDLAQYGAFWSGEIAVGKYISYLKPQEAILYLPESSGNQLLAFAKLKKRNAQSEFKSSAVHIYRPFWTDKLEYLAPAAYPDTVHPILIYADLIASQDSRNLETARMLYDTSITEFIGED